MSVSNPEISVAEQIKKVPPLVRPTVNAARRMVKAVAPEAKEIAYQSKPPRSTRAMWKLVRYAIGDANVAAIGTFPTYAALFFYRGRELEDGSGLLEGGGKEFRFIRVRAPADALQPAVKRVVRKAFALERTTVARSANDRQRRIMRAPAVGRGRPPLMRHRAKRWRRARALSSPRVG